MNNMTNQSGKDNGCCYTIVVDGHLEDRWTKWFPGMEVIRLPEGITRLRGSVDQSALHGMFSRIRDLQLSILLVKREDD